MASYTGPIFDVQTHAIKPDAYDAVSSGLWRDPALTDKTKEIITKEICVNLADDLKGNPRLQLLGEDTVQVVTINTFFPPFPAEQLIAMTDELNEWMAKATADKSQLIGIASIPPPPVLAKAGELYVKRGLDVLRKAITQLDLKGVLFASNYDNTFLGDTVYEPYFALVEELKVPIIIHPAVHPVEAPAIQRKNIPGCSGFLNDQRTTLVDLILAGILEKYPKLIIIATHLGGGILSTGRTSVLQQRFPAEYHYSDHGGQQRELPQPFANYQKMIYYDCNNAEVTDILHAISKVGADHLVTGTDFPWTNDKFTREVLSQLDESIRMKIAYDNAAKLFSR